jgi:hypothetical protein
LHPNATIRGKFEVVDHCEIALRGVFVVGLLREGTMKLGMKVRTNDAPELLTVAAMEYMESPRTGQPCNALKFDERPTLEFVQQAFPIGSFLEAEAYAS